jgi:hypothetical protein
VLGFKLIKPHWGQIFTTKHPHVSLRRDVVFEEEFVLLFFDVVHRLADMFVFGYGLRDRLLSSKASSSYSRNHHSKYFLCYMWLAASLGVFSWIFPCNDLVVCIHCL